jgi:predicted amidophosphoribosyltransferase
MSQLGSVRAFAAYGGVLAELIKRYKFERARAAYEPLSRLLATSLPDGDWHLVPIPTATNHIR